MIEQWILDKLEPLKKHPLIILRDPQRMIRSGARAVDGWAQELGFTVLFCTGNLALREMYERLRSQPDVKLLLVDRTREGQLFYPDIEAALLPRKPIQITLRDFLVEQTGDPAFPQLVNEKNLARLLLMNIEAVCKTHSYLREISPGRFTDSDLYRIILGAALQINPFVPLTPSQVRRFCLEQHHMLNELQEHLPEDARKILQEMIQSAPKPFCYLLERDTETLLRAFTLAGLMRQHGLDHALLLANLDPALHEYKNIEAETLDVALKDLISADPDRILADVQKAEEFLMADPKRLEFLLHDQLHLDDPKLALEVLKKEQLSNLLRSIALATLLVNLILNRDWSKHQKNLLLLEKQEQEASFPVLRRPAEQWQQLLAAYRRAILVFELTDKLKKEYLDLKVSQTGELNFQRFDQLWNQQRLNRLDYYISDLERMLRVSDMLPLPMGSLWQEFTNNWSTARNEFKEIAKIVDDIFKVINRQFQDLYHQNYTKWIQQTDATVTFTHQFLSRVLKTHWDPKSGRKAVILVFDGLRTDAWEEFVRPVMEERFEIIESRPGSALIPTETDLSRKAIAAGALPAEFPIKSRRELDLLAAWLKTNMGISPQFTVLRDDETIASGMTMRYQSTALEYIVFNFTDDNLHHNSQDLAFIYNTTVREIIRQDVRSVLRDLPTDALIFITSDHGFTPMPAGVIDLDDSVIADQELVKYRSARAAHKLITPEGQKTVSFDIRALTIPIPDVARGNDRVQFLLFPRPGYYFQRAGSHRPPDRFSHGGLSMAECLVPMVVMGARKTDQGILTLDDLRQGGSMLEGESFELELHIRSSQMLFEGIPITLTFSLEELPERRELFTGVEKVIRVQWQPRLPEITEADRNRGFVEFPVTAILTYRHKEQTHRHSCTVDVRIKLDTTRLRRRIDSKLDLMMGKMPGEMNS